jgi:hypothetical protein
MSRRYSNYDGPTSIILIVVCIILVIFLEQCSVKTNSQKINEKVHSINGEVIDIDEKSIFSKMPFTWNTKEMKFYKFIYTVNGETKVGWLRSKAFGEDWIMDYEEN